MSVPKNTGTTNSDAEGSKKVVKVEDPKTKTEENVGMAVDAEGKPLVTGEDKTIERIEAEAAHANADASESAKLAVKAAVDVAADEKLAAEKAASAKKVGLTVDDKEASDMGVSVVGRKVSQNPLAADKARTQDEVRLAVETETQPAVYPPSLTPVPIGGENVQRIGNPGAMVIEKKEAQEGETLYVVQGGPIAPYGNGPDAVEAHGGEKARLYQVGEVVSLSPSLARAYVKISRLAPYIADTDEDFA